MKKYYLVKKGMFVLECLVKVLDGVLFNFECGKMLVVVGEFGCGKLIFGWLLMMIEMFIGGELYY